MEGTASISKRKRNFVILHIPTNFIAIEKTITYADIGAFFCTLLFWTRR